jgi:hypothetical protein
MKGQIDEFALILLAGLILIVILAVIWTSQASTQITVMPDSKQLTIAKGSSSSFPIFMNGSAKNVTLKASGEIADWIRFDRSSLDVDGERKVTVYVDVPTTASYGIHWGEIYITTLGFEKKISIAVNVSRRTEEKTKSIDFGDFNVGYVVGEETIAEKSGLRVERGFFSEFSPSFAVVFSEEKLSMVAEGYLQIIVDQTNSLGNLIVEFDDKKIFDKKVSVGEIIIPVEKELIKKSNSVVLKTTTPGLVFWSSSIYVIASSRFVAKYNETIFKEFNFSLTDFEVKNLKEAKLSFFVRQHNLGIPQEMNKLIIKINDQKIYEDIPPSYFVKKLVDVNFNPGTNTISFSTEKGASYLLEDVELKITQY